MYLREKRKILKGNIKKYPLLREKCLKLNRILKYSHFQYIIKNIHANIILLLDITRRKMYVTDFPRFSQ